MEIDVSCYCRRIHILSIDHVFQKVFEEYAKYFHKMVTPKSIDGYLKYDCPVSLLMFTRKKNYSVQVCMYSIRW